MFPLTPDPRYPRTPARDTEEIQRGTGRVIPAVFHRAGEPIQAFRHGWRGAVKRAGLTVTVVRHGKQVIKSARIPHDFRRTAVSNLGSCRYPALGGDDDGRRHRTEAIYRELDGT